jgi:nitrite reductase (NADH) large subunit
LFDYYLHLAQWIVTTLGIYMAMRIFIRMSELRAAALSAMAALVIFYWFTGPGIVGTLASFAGAEAPDWSREAIVAVVALVAIKVLFNGWSAERDFKALNKPQSGDPVKVGVKLDAVRAGGGSVAGDLVTDRASGRSFAADGSRTLLEGIESAGLTQDFGCRMGMCGADAVAVVEGMENLSPPGDDEVATLRRLGLEGRARMACVCRPMAGGVVIDLKMNPNDLPEPPPPPNLVDHGEQAGIERVVIIGNGAGGISAADEVRRLSPSVKIDVIARENQPFYNRMAIGRLLYGRTGLDDLFLMTPDWYAKKQIDVWLNTQAIAIDRENRLVSLGTGEQIPYDRLVLAMGSRATIPEAEGSDLPGCFVLREAADAQVIRAWRQTHACRHAVVQGGGVLGVEAADALRRLNLRTTIVQRSDRLMNRELDETGSAILQRFLGNLTIEVATGASVVRIIGDGRVQAVELTDGRILDADIYIACAGVQANTELAAAAGLQVDRGIVVDHSMRTSDPLIFAVGDVAQVPGAVSGLWPVATAQASVAAAALFGQEAKYEPPSTLVSLKMDSIDVKGFGNLKVGEGEEEIVHDEGDTVHRRLVISGGRIKGAVFVGPPGTAKPLPAAIQKRADLTAILPRLRNGDWAALSEL